MLRIYKAFFYSMQGLDWGFRNEPALRQEMIGLIIGLPLAALVAPNALWFFLMAGGLLLLLAVELLNTGLEKLADFITVERHDAVGRVKDLGSAAVFAMLVWNGMIWAWALAVRLF